MSNYRIFVDIYGRTNFYRVCPEFSTSLVDDIEQDDTEIQLTDVLPLFNNNPLLAEDFNNDTKKAGVAWLYTESTSSESSKSERIEFYAVNLSTNTLIQCRRGTEGTPKLEHLAAETIVQDGSQRQSLLNTEMENETILSTGTQSVYTFPRITTTDTSNLVVRVGGNVQTEGVHFDFTDTDPLEVSFTFTPAAGSNISVVQNLGFTNADVLKYPWNAAIEDFLACGSTPTPPPPPPPPIIEALTWTLIPVNTNSTRLRAVSSDGNGVWIIVAESVFSPPSPPQILRSTDDGLNWTSISNPFLDFTDNVDIGLTTNGSGTWVFAGRADASTSELGISTDNGLTWSTITTPNNPLTNAQKIRHLAYSNTSTWIGVGNSGTVIRSTDNGATWTIIANPFPLNRINFVSTDNNGVWVAVGQGGNAIRSTDDGLTWSTVPTTVSNELHTVSTDNNGIWIAGGTSETVIRSTDNGASWGTITYPFPQNATWFAGSNNVDTWILAGGGTAFLENRRMIRSDDGGLTWSPLSLPATPANTFNFDVYTPGTGTWLSAGGPPGGNYLLRSVPEP